MAGDPSTSPALKERIEAYTGPLSITLSDYIRQSVSKVLELVPEKLLAPYATFHSNIGSGVSVAHKKVMAVSRNARMISETDLSKYMDPGSIYYVATARDSVFWISDGMLHTLPEDGDVALIDYADVDEKDVEITCLPPQFTDAVALDVAIQVLNGQITQVANELFELNAVSVNESDMPALVYPSALGALTVTWNSVATIDTDFAADITTGLSTLRASLETVKGEVEAQLATGTEDIELGIARLSHAKSLLDEYAQKSDILLKRILADSDIEKVNKMKAYEKTIEDAHNALSRASHELEVFTNHGQLIVAVRKEKNDQVTAATQLMQTLQARFNAFFAPYQEARQPS